MPNANDYVLMARWMEWAGEPPERISQEQARAAQHVAPADVPPDPDEDAEDSIEPDAPATSPGAPVDTLYIRPDGTCARLDDLTPNHPFRELVEQE
jgi:hypothetical protein